MSVDPLLRALHARRRDIDDETIAEALHGDRTTVSRVFSDQYGIKLSRLPEFLAAMGYRAIPVTSGIREVPESDYQSLLQMAAIGTESLRQSERHRRYSRPEKTVQIVRLLGRCGADDDPVPVDQA